MLCWQRHGNLQPHPSDFYHMTVSQRGIPPSARREHGSSRAKRVDLSLWTTAAHYSCCSLIHRVPLEILKRAYRDCRCKARLRVQSSSQLQRRLADCWQRGHAFLPPTAPLWLSFACYPTERCRRITPRRQLMTLSRCRYPTATTRQTSIPTRPELCCPASKVYPLCGALLNRLGA
jgi:hypothetical protein